MTPINNLISFKIMSMLITPFENTQAFRLGVIDKNGQRIIPFHELNQDQLSSYTMLDRLVFNIKKMINHLPGGENKIKNLMAAFMLTKECVINQTEDSTLESLIEYVDKYRYITPLEETLMYEEVMANNTSNVSGFKSDDTAVPKSKKPKTIIRRNTKSLDIIK